MVAISRKQDYNTKDVINLNQFQDFLISSEETTISERINRIQKLLLSNIYENELELLTLISPNSEILECLLQYLLTIPERRYESRIKIIRLIKRAGGCSLFSIKKILEVADEEPRLFIFENFTDLLCPTDIYEAAALIEDYWSSIVEIEKYRIFRTLGHFSDDILDWSIWRERALALLPKLESINQVGYIWKFLFTKCQNSSTAQSIINCLLPSFKISNLSISNPKDDKKARTLVPYKKCSIRELFDYIFDNKFAVEIIKNGTLINACDFAALTMIFLWRFGKNEQRIVIDALKDWESYGCFEVAIKLLLDEDRNRMTKTIINMAQGIALARLLKVSKILFTSLIRVCNSYESRDILLHITSLATESRHSTWAIKLLCEIPKSFSANHGVALKVLYDYLDRLDTDNLELYYECLFRNALYLLRRNFDSSLWNDLIIITRKQITSLNENVRTFGAYAVLAMLKVLSSDCHNDDDGDDGGDDEEATCSQMPRKESSNRKYLNAWYSLLEDAFSLVNVDVNSIQLLCHRLPEMLKDAPIAESVVRVISPLFESTFVFDLLQKPINQLNDNGDEYRLEYNLDGKEASIGVTFKENSKLAMVVYDIFHLIQILEKLVHDGELNNIDALLGCPILVTNPLSDLQKLFLNNWLKTLINAFHNQDDKEIQEKCKLRFDQLTQISIKSIGVPSNPPISDKVDTDDYELLQWINTVKINFGNPTKTQIKGDLKAQNRVVLLCPQVLYKFFNFNKEFVLNEIQSYPSLQPFTNDQLQMFISLLGNEISTLPIHVNLLRELRKRDLTVAFNPLDWNLELMDAESLCFLLEIATILGKQPKGWNRIFEESIEACFDSTKSSIIQSEILLKRVLSLNKDDIDLIMVLTERVISGNEAKKKAIKFHSTLTNYLSEISLNGWEVIEKAAICFEKLVNFCRHNIEDGYSEGILTHGKDFIVKFHRFVYPIIKVDLPDPTKRTIILQVLKTLQASTRSIQIICNYLKAKRKHSNRRLLPPMRRSLEQLIYGCKQILQENNCLSAFWIGNLKHRNIDGTEIGSQIEVESETDEPNSCSSSCITTDTEGEKQSINED